MFKEIHSQDHVLIETSQDDMYTRITLDGLPFTLKTGDAGELELVVPTVVWHSLRKHGSPIEYFLDHSDEEIRELAEEFVDRRTTEDRNIPEQLHDILIAGSRDNPRSVQVNDFIQHYMSVRKRLHEALR